MKIKSSVSKMPILHWIVLIGIVFSGTSFSQEIAINEFLARNDAVASDQDSEFDDWIELYNYGSSTISLNGLFLSDNREDLSKWSFPDTSINAGGFIIVWADNNPEQIGLHAEFKLSGSGEEIYLSDPESNIIDEVTYGVQTTDISIGRIPNGTGQYQPMVPTFSSFNSSEEPRHENISDTLFNADVIHRYELRFYTDNWQDSLEYNYEALDQEYMPAQLIYNDSVILDSIGVRYKGNSSYIRSGATVKKPFKFRFDKYIEDQLLFGIERLNFSNSVSDPTFMREMIGYNISSKLMPSPRAVYANIYVEDDLIGLYVQVEQVDEIFLNRFFTSNGFNLYKASDDGATLKYFGDDQSAYEAEYELKANEVENDWSGFIDLIDKLNNTPDDQFVETLNECLNIYNVIRHLAFNMVLSSFDSYTGSGRNFYFYDDEDSGKFNLIPWDLNETFGTYTNNWNVTTADAVLLSNANDRPLSRKIMQNDSLRMVYFDVIRELIEGPASYDSIVALTEQYLPLIEGHVIADQNKLYSDEMFFENINGDVRITLGQVIPGLKSFSVARSENLLGQIADFDVYPGDCDNNGVVDAFDILPIGLYFHSEGQKRGDVSFGWEPKVINTWYTRAATYADANGDGIVDEMDVIGIGVNWGNSYEGASTTFEIDPMNLKIINQHRDSFSALYKSLSGDNEAVVQIRNLLENILKMEPTVPLSYALEQNFPNPFNPTTTIRFSLPESQVVNLTVYDLMGQEVMSPIENGSFNTGQHDFILDASSLSNGIYIYRFQSANWGQSRKMVIVK
ncbi:MAG: T9SS type A sorting domain-containing protein [Calditrichaeota bacterium]|nr:T9SS type A sorting domain-containing protein [Calditrichota bacterium]